MKVFLFLSFKKKKHPWLPQFIFRCSKGETCLFLQFTEPMKGFWALSEKCSCINAIFRLIQGDQSGICRHLVLEQSQCHWQATPLWYSPSSAMLCSGLMALIFWFEDEFIYSTETEKEIYVVWVSSSSTFMVGSGSSMSPKWPCR